MRNVGDFDRYNHTTHSYHGYDYTIKTGIRKYYPILVVFILATLFSLSTKVTSIDAIPYVPEEFLNFTNGIMGFTFCLLAMFKLFDIASFVEGFESFDFLTKRVKIYGLLYPFIELYLGVAYLNNFMPLETNITTLIMMSITLIGIGVTTMVEKDLKWEAIGTGLNTPLITITIMENIAMIAFSLINIMTILK
ncbi:MAG: hypothetical protein J0H68_03750 [Sphingobacteriia bacterium]|nr:hypothetical protein [Sphingobacteriia bacterium]